MADTTYPFVTRAALRVSPFWAPLKGKPKFKHLLEGRRHGIRYSRGLRLHLGTQGPTLPPAPSPARMSGLLNAVVAAPT